jgi:hypothetical protein
MTVIEDAYGDVAGYLRTSKGTGTRQLLDVATAADDVQLANELLAHVSLTESSLRAVLPAQILGRSPNVGAFMTVRGMMASLLNPAAVRNALGSPTELRGPIPAESDSDALLSRQPQSRRIRPLYVWHCRR